MKNKQNAQIKHFQDEVLKYLDLFGLGRWSVKWENWNAVVADNPDFEDAAAAACNNTGSRLAKFSVNPTVIADKSDTYISRCALHEVTHVLTARLEDYAYAVKADSEAVSEETEAIAKAMERAFFGPVDM
jgi:hypothetical protein